MTGEWLFLSPSPCRFIHWLSTVLVFPILPFPKLEDTETFGHVSFVVRKHGIQIRARITKVRTPSGDIIYVVVLFITIVYILSCIVPSIQVYGINQIDHNFSAKGSLY